MSLLIGNYRKGYRFICPVTKKFHGPYFKSVESIQGFWNWYDGDVRYIGTWVSNNKVVPI